MPYSAGVSGNQRGRPKSLEVALRRLGEAAVAIEELTNRSFLAARLLGRDQPDLETLMRIETARRHLHRDVAELALELARGGQSEEPAPPPKGRQRRRQRRLDREREAALVELGAWIERSCGGPEEPPN